jgi:hypothetical protein
VRLVEGEASRDAGRARQRFVRGDAETGERAATAVLGRRVRRALPRVLATGHAAAQRERDELAAPLLRQWQVLGQLRQRRNVDLVERQAPAGDRAVGVLVQRERHCERDRQELLAALRPERESLRDELPPTGLAFPRDPSAEMRQLELRQVLRDPAGNARQLEIGDDVGGHASGEVEPHAHRALAALHRPQQRDPLAPLRHVGVIEAHVEASLRLAPILGRHGRDLAAKIERRGQRRRWSADEAEPVTTEALLDPEHHVLEHQRRSAAQFVVPRDQRVAYIDFPLAQQPVGKPCVVGLRVRIDLDARDVQAPRAVPAHRELRTLDIQFPQSQVQRQDRRPCDHQVDFRQQQDGRRSRVGAIADREAADRELGVPAVPARVNGFDRHWLPKLPGQLFGDRRAVVVDAGKDDEANREQQRAEHEHRNQNRVAGEADEACRERGTQGENL